MKNIIRNSVLSVMLTGLTAVSSAQNTSVGSPQGSLAVSDLGAAVYNLSIEAPDGGPMTPQIGIAYNSQMSGYGLAGYGMNITGISCITRGGKDLFHDNELRGVTYTTSDNLFLDGTRLILKSGTPGQDGAVYTLEGNPYTEVTEHLTTRQEQCIIAGDYWIPCQNCEDEEEYVPPVYGSRDVIESWYFVIKDKTGTVYQYGNTNDSKLNLYEDCIVSWHINKAEDRYGNYVTYQYDTENRLVKPLTITYGSNSKKDRGLTGKIAFEYQSLGVNSRPFVIKDKKGMMDICLSSVTTSLNNQTYRKYSFTYDGTSDQTQGKFTRLVSVTEENGAGDKYNPIVFDWNYLSNTLFNSLTLNVSTHDTRNKMVFSEKDDAKSFFASDLNGDGIDDIIRISTGTIEQVLSSDKICPAVHIAKSMMSNSGEISYQNTYVSEIESIELFSNSAVEKGIGQLSNVDFDGDGYNDLFIPIHTEINGHWSSDCVIVVWGGDSDDRVIGKINLDFTTLSQYPIYCAIDANGNGKGELFCLEKKKDNGSYHGYVCRYGTDSKILKTEFSLSLPNDPQKIFTGDYDNDGLTDLLILHDDGYKIYFNNGGTESARKFTESRSSTGMNVCNFWRIEQGDFDGDGLIDFVYSVDGETCLRIAHNNGNGSFTCSKAYELGFGNKNGSIDNDKFSIKVWDADHDGRSDVMVCKASYKYHGGFDPHYSFIDTKAIWLLSDGEKLVLDKSYTKHREEDSFERYLFLGDFDGDGYIELANYGSSLVSTYDTFEENKINVYKSGGDLSQAGKITSVTDGFGNASSIRYDYLTNPNVYKKEIESEYPVNVYTIPLSVVTKVTSDNGANAPVTTEYSYKDLKVQTAGRGLLGFGSMKKTNQSLNTTETTTVSWDESLLIPKNVKTTVSIGNKSSEKLTKFTIKKGVNDTYFSYVSGETGTDMDGNKTLVSTQYDTDLGVITERTETCGGDDMFKKESYMDYHEYSGIPLPGKKIVTLKHKDDASPYVSETHYTYDNLGNVLSQTTNAGTDMALTTTMTYDIYGNVRSSVAMGNGVKPVTKRYDYDSRGLHVVKSYTTPASFVTLYAYDGFGKLLTETDATTASNPLTTTHTYDGWGRRVSSVSPTGVRSTTTIGWGSSDLKKYIVKETCSGQPDVTTWYDKAGRETESQSVGLKGVSVSKTTTYDDKGQIAATVSKNGSLTVTQSFEYDERGRVTKESSSSGRTVTYSYDSLTVTTRMAGREYTKTVDAWGNVVKTTDPASSVTYTYFSNGKPKKVTANGKSVTMEYDAAGNKTKLIDPDAGTMTYAYAADGSILSQTDGNGFETVNTYDNLGRLASSRVGQRTIAYGYGSEGYENMKLKSVTMSGLKIEYAHDKFGHVVSEVRTVPGNVDYAFAFTYNNIDQLSSTTYPGGLTETYQYDSNGFKTQTKANGMTIYDVESYDGKVRKESFMGKLKTTYTCNDKGYETSRMVSRGNTIVQRFLMSHDVNTGNLLSRQRNDNPAETFAYDDMDRLISITANGEETMGMTYSANGNILSKSDIGKYFYLSKKPHAVTNIYNVSLRTNESLKTAFNDFGKIAHVEDSLSDGSRLVTDFVYGPDQERCLSISMKNGSVSRMTVYAGSYEKVKENGVTREFYYLEGNVIVVKQNGDFTPYLAFTDNLGSILSLMDENGDAVFEAEYDAWGKPTVSLNEIGFHRGYTGHEMLPEFDLINMNGRLYDPMIGRFLSPDNYVQAPDDSQNFNRYSYCLNNPLKYTDSSGELFGIDDAVWAFAFFNMASSMMHTAANGGSTGDIWKAGGISLLTSLGSYGIGSACSALANAHVMSSTGVELFRAGAHGLNNGIASALSGGNFGRGFISGATASGMGSFASSVHMNSGLMLASTSVMGGISSWTTGGSFFDGAMTGLNIGFYNHSYHILLPEVECVANGKNMIIWPTITNILYIANMVNGRYSKGSYQMFSNGNLVYSCTAVSGSPTKYTIPSGEYHVNDIWRRSLTNNNDRGFFRMGTGYTASLKEDPFYDRYAGRNRKYIRIHPCRDRYTEGCIGLIWDDRSSLDVNFDMIRQTIRKDDATTYIPLEVYILGR